MDWLKWETGFDGRERKALTGDAVGEVTFEEGLKGNDRRRWAVNSCES